VRLSIDNIGKSLISKQARSPRCSYYASVYNYMTPPMRPAFIERHAQIKNDQVVNLKQHHRFYSCRKVSTRGCTVCASQCMCMYDCSLHSVETWEAEVRTLTVKKKNGQGCVRVPVSAAAWVSPV